jgi:hypothetical protein
MVAQWRRAMEDEALRARLAAGAQRAVTETYTMENMARGFLRSFGVADGVERALVVPEGWVAGG